MISLVRFNPLPSKPYLPSLSHPTPSRNSSLLSLKTPPFSLSWRSKSRKNPKTTISMSYGTVPAIERLISATSYLLPFFNGLHYGRYIFMRFPKLELVFEPLFPLISAYRSVPYASFVAFFALYLAVVRNPNFSRYVRFNAMQALFLDVLLVVPLLLERIFSPSSGLGFRLVILGHNFIFMLLVSCFAYCVGYCVIGRTPALPFVAKAAGAQI
ncbi:hypothetical protein AMTRI_Chr06g200670 [Amborella trichopoda]